MMKGKPFAKKKPLPSIPMDDDEDDEVGPTASDSMENKTKRRAIFVQKMKSMGKKK